VRAWTVAVSAVSVVAVLAVCALTAQERTLVLEGGTLIDGTGRPPVADAVVVVQGTRIRSIGTKGRVSYPAGATVMRLDGRTILPGLIDGHVHLQEWEVPMFLPYGITTIADIHDAYRSGRLTARQLVQTYLDRIASYDKQGPAINAVISTNPAALAEADALDRSFKTTGLVGPLHGIPGP